MKKTILFLGIALGLVACEDEIVFNETALQAKVSAHGMEVAPDHLIRFDYHEAFVDNGNLLIKGGTERDTLEIYIPNYSFGTRYELSNNNFSAKFKTLNEDSIVMEMNTNIELDGYVFLKPAEEQTPQSISGSFAFDMNHEIELGGGIEIPENLSFIFRFYEGTILNVPINHTPPEIMEDDIVNPEE